MQSEYLGVSDTFNFQEIEVKGEKQYLITGYISTKSIDKFDDLITDECLDDMLIQIKSGSIKMDYEHETIHENNLNKTPIARIIDAKRDNKGIWVKALINSTHDKFNEIWGSIKNGFLDSFSIAFKPIETATKYIQGKAIRLLNKLKLINVGITGTPVNDECKMDKVVIKAIKDMDTEWKSLDELDETELKHKYIKRTGRPGNYTYFYSEAEYEKAKGEKQKESGNDYEKNIEEFGQEGADAIEDKRQELHQEWRDKMKEVEYEHRLNPDGRKIEMEKATERYKQKEKEVVDYMKTKMKIKKKKKAEGIEKKESYNKEINEAISKKKELSKEEFEEKIDKISKKYRLNPSYVMNEAESRMKTRTEKEELPDPSEPSTYPKEVWNKSQDMTSEKGYEYLREWYKKNIENKALTTTSFPVENHTSHSPPLEVQEKMAEENVPVETEEIQSEAVQSEPEKSEPEKSEEPEKSDVKEELAEVKSQLVKIQKLLEKPQIKAIQEAEPRQLNKNVTALSLVR